MLSLVTIALGVGVNVGVFAVVQAVLLRPPPYANGSRVVAVGERRLTGPYRANAVSTLNYLDWRARNTVFADIAAWSDPRGCDFPAEQAGTEANGRGEKRGGGLKHHPTARLPPFPLTLGRRRFRERRASRSFPAARAATSPLELHYPLGRGIRVDCAP